MKRQNRNKFGVQTGLKNIEPARCILKNLLDRQVLLLICLPAGFHNRKTIEEKLKVKRNTLHYSIKRLLKRELIEEHRDQDVLYYTPTKKGRHMMFKILTGYDNFLSSESDRAHDLQFKIKIVKEPKNRKKWVEDGTWFSVRPHNRIDWLRTIEDIRIQKTTRNLIFYIEEYYAKDSDTAIAKSQSNVLKVIKFLLNEYPDLKLDRYMRIKVIRQHHAMQNDEFALWCKAHGIRLLQRTDNSGNVILQIDYSKDKIPETEFTHPKKSQDHYMRYDEMKKKIRDLPHVIEKKGEDFADMIVEYIEKK